MTISEILNSPPVIIAVLGVILWMLRNIWLEWIKQVIRSDFNSSFEQLQAQIRESEAEVAALREGALQNIKDAHAALYARRLEAVDELWSAVTAWQKFGGTLMTTAILTMPEVREIRGNNSQEEWFKVVLSKVEIDLSPMAGIAERARPYVSDLAWAMYSAYSAMFAWATVQATSLKNGMEFEAAIDPDRNGLRSLLKTALPDMETYIDENWLGTQMHAPEILRRRILTELRRTLDGQEQDRASVERAKAILTAVEEVQAKHAKQETTNLAQQTETS